MSSHPGNSTKSSDIATQQTGKASKQTSTSGQSQEDSDYTSSSGSSSEDEEESDPSTKPIQGAHDLKNKIKPNNDLKSRLATFLPEIERSNRDLEADGEVHSRRIDDVNENEDHYIEMNLGLGVLCEKESNGDGIAIRSRTSDDEEEPGQTARVTKSTSDPTVKKKIEEI